MTAFDIEDAIYQYLHFRRGRERFQKNEDGLKKNLLTYLSDHGEKDDRGSTVYRIGEPADDVTGVKRERRVSQVMDEEYALELIKKHNLEDVCLETITVINEDGILAANFSGILSDVEISRLYSEKETYAFVLLKD
jgi:hypothetical protein